jgi:DNA-binding Lrp family transcriptional regulator
MSKVNLKDMKSHNRRLILQSIITGQSFSRIALSQTTGLSPSTVTSLVSELLEEKILVESGVTLSTGGRGRKELNINSDYGLIVVVEIGRRRTSLCTYDMSLEKLEERLLTERRLSGNNLFFEISTAIFDQFYQQPRPKGTGYVGSDRYRLYAGSNTHEPTADTNIETALKGEVLDPPANKKGENLRLAGIGLLFQEDMIESDLNVMFSTSLSADNISLREALYTQFKVPVVGEYSVSELLSVTETGEVKNSVHVTLANMIRVSLTIDGRPLQMKEGKSANITGILSAFQFEKPRTEIYPGDPKKEQPPLFPGLAGILALLCTLFTLDNILLSGESVHTKGFVSVLRETLGMILSPALPPPIKIQQSMDSKLNEKMAYQVRNIALGSTV